MTWRDTADRLGLIVPRWKVHALDYCESHGLKFCIHFGTDNAVQIAREHWRKRKQRKKL